MQRVFDPESGQWHEFPDDATPEEMTRALSTQGSAVGGATLESGNIDLQHRPVVRNPDGSISTVRSMSFGENGQEILVPTVSPEGRLLSDQEAIDLYHRTGQHLGKFATPDAATAYAQRLHEDQARLYGGAAPEQAGPPAPPPEHPGFFARQLQPGGMLSPENVGITGGGMLGATLGAPLGPPGMLAGGLLGAGVGGILGRGSEMIAPEQRPATLAEALGQLGEASQRGLVSQAVGDIGGALLGKAVAPLANRMTPERQAIARAAQEAGVPMTAGQLTGSKALGMVENMVPRSPFSVGQAEDFLQGQEQGITNALTNYAAGLAPGVSRDLTEAGQAVAPPIINAATRPQQFLTRQAATAKNLLNDFLDRVAPGAARDLQEAGQIADQSLKQRFVDAKGAAKRLYTAAYAATNGQKFPLDDYANAVQQVLSEEGPLGQLGTGMGAVGQSTLRATQSGASAFTNNPRILALLSQTPQNAADVETMHGIRSELMKIVRDSARRSGFGMDPEGRAATLLLNGMDASLQKVKDQVPPLGPLLDAADTYYKTEVAQVFKEPRVMRSFAALAKEGKFDQIVPLVFGPGKSIGPLQAFKKAAGQDTFDQSAASWFQHLIDKASSQGQFSIEQFLSQMDPRKYSPQFLEEALGPERARDLQKLTATFAKVGDVANALQAPPVIEAMAAKAQAGQFDQLIPAAFGAGKSVGTLQAFKSEVGPAATQQAAAAWMQDLTNKAFDAQTGHFSLQRYLTAVGPQRYGAPFLTEALGPQKMKEFGRLRDVLQAVQEGALSGANPSQTARAVIGWSQVMGLLGLTGKILYQGEATPGDVGRGVGLLAPNMIGRILFSPTGIRWLSQGLEAQTPQQLTHLATKLATLAVYPSTAEQARLEEERRRRMGQ